MADFIGAQYAADTVLAGLKKAQITGLPPANITFSAAAGDGKATLKWSAADTIVEDQLLCTVKGVMIRRSSTATPTSITDGDLVIDTTELSGSYEDSGLTNDTTYYYKAFPYSDHGVYNYNEANNAEVTPKEYTLYGFTIAKSNSTPASRVTYREMAEGFTPAAVDLSTGSFSYGSWADAWFVKNNKPCMVKSDGTVDYYLDPDDYTKKEDGTTASDVSSTSYDGNAMAEIPLVWIKSWDDGTNEYVNICDQQLDEDYHAYAHTRADGTVADNIYLALFEGALSSSKVRSIKGLTPMNAQTGANELTYAKANGTGWSTRSWSQRNLINMLLILMARTTDLQTAFGYGYYTGGSSSSPNYLTTGGASDKGQFYGTNANRNYVKVFHIENWWGDIWERIEGCVTDSSKQILIKETPDYNTSGRGYTATGIIPGGTSGGYISADTMEDYGLIPKTASGSSSTYLCDGLWFAASCYALVGGSSFSGLIVGPFALDLSVAVSISDWSVGAALSCKP